MCVLVFTQRGWTAVLISAADGHLDMLRELLEHHGADLYRKAKVSDRSFTCVLFNSTSAVCLHTFSVWLTSSF